MKYDLGTTSAAPDQDHRFCRVRHGWRGELEPELSRELVILCRTPGIPIEWLYQVFKWSPAMRRKVMALLNSVDDVNVQAEENRHSVTLEDGFAMLWVLDPPHGYHGAIPLWSQLAL